MLPQVFLICKTNVDTSLLLRLTQQALGRSISQGVDDLNWSVGDLASFLSMLGETTQPGSNPIALIRNPGHLLTHVSLSFLAVVDRDTLMELMEKSRLFFVTAGTLRQGLYLALVSGNLEDWRTSVINLCTDRESQAVRVFITSVTIGLEKLGLGSIFAEYSREFRSDSTIRLLPRS